MSYYRNLLMYGRILAQRNAYLKDDVRDMDLLAVWDENRIHYGAALIWQRYQFMKKISRICAKIHHDLTGGKESLSLEYAADCGLAAISAFEEEMKEAGISFGGDKKISKKSWNSCAKNCGRQHSTRWKRISGSAIRRAVHRKTISKCCCAKMKKAPSISGILDRRDSSVQRRFR